MGQETGESPKWYLLGHPAQEAAQGSALLAFDQSQEYGHEVLELGLAEDVAKAGGELTQGS